jgi:hypothetical protein
MAASVAVLIVVAFGSEVLTAAREKVRQKMTRADDDYDDNFCSSGKTT